MIRHFPAASPSAAKQSTVASVLFTVTSSQGHVNHVFTIMTLFHSPNSEIFIAPEQYIFITTVSVVKDAADDPDCPGLREPWYYLRFYVRHTMPPTVGCCPSGRIPSDDCGIPTFSSNDVTRSAEHWAYPSSKSLKTDANSCTKRKECLPFKTT